MTDAEMTKPHMDLYMTLESNTSK